MICNGFLFSCTYNWKLTIFMILCRLYRCIITKTKSIPADTMEVIMKTGYAPNFIPAKTGKKLNTSYVPCSTILSHFFAASSMYKSGGISKLYLFYSVYIFYPNSQFLFTFNWIVNDNFPAGRAMICNTGWFRPIMRT